MTWIYMLVNIGILAYGAVTDYKRREIPDIVPIVLLLTGLVSGWDFIFLRVAGLLLTALLFMVSAKVSKSGLPGGDFKLISALAFSAGIPILLFTLLLTSLGAAFVGIVKKQPTKRHIPLCTYIAPAYTVVCGLLFIITL